MSYNGSLHATDDGRRGRDQWPQGDWAPNNPAANARPVAKPKPAPLRQPGKTAPRAPGKSDDARACAPRKPQGLDVA